ncbi:hypothetical protein [Bradyrhizobium sp. Leo170]|uniref:hypothetical protein n=1 Tax=Bradyrhizobium sp. Leo170 TaxID=1571199 RepID=UPI00102E529C|nr:hypothetical protein [Bradyrhizobium sp. Leo170]
MRIDQFDSNSLGLHLIVLLRSGLTIGSTSWAIEAEIFGQFIAAMTSHPFHRTEREGIAPPIPARGRHSGLSVAEASLVFARPQVLRAINLILADMPALLQFSQPVLNEISGIVVVWVEKAREHSRGRASPPRIVGDCLNLDVEQARVSGEPAR